MFRYFRHEYRSARSDSIVCTNGDAIGFTILTTIAAALIGAMGGHIQSGIGGDEGTEGQAVSAIQKDNYTTEANRILADAIKLGKLKEATGVLKDSGVFDRNDPVLGGKISEMESAYAERFSELKTSYDKVAYNVVTDKTLGESDAENVIEILAKVNSNIEPEWVEKIEHRGLQECRPLYSTATPEQTGRLIAECSDAVSFKEGVNFFSVATTLGFAGGLAGFFGVPAARALRSARRNYVTEKEREKNVRTQVVKERHTGPE